MPFDATPITNDVIEKLQQMHKLLSRRGGWIKHQLSNGRGGYCILGAAENVGFNLFDADGILGVSLDSRYALVEFNDAKGRRKQHVLDLIQVAIERERIKILARANR